MTEQPNETSKSTVESPKIAKKPSVKKGLPERGWSMIYALGALVFVIVLIVAVSWEKVIEPRLGFDLPDSTQDVDTAEYMSLKPAPVGHIMSEEATLVSPLAPLQPVPVVAPSDPQGLGQVLDTLGRQLDALVSRTPFHRQEIQIKKLMRIQVLEGALQGRVPLNALGDFLFREGGLPLPPSLTGLSHLKSREQMVYEIDASEEVEVKKARESSASFWESLKTWAASLVHVEKDSGVSAEDVNHLKYLIRGGQWIEALRSLHALPAEWRRAHGDLEDQIKSHLDLEYLLETAYRDLMEGTAP